MRQQNLFPKLVFIMCSLIIIKVSFSSTLEQLFPEQSLTHPWYPHGSLKEYVAENLFDYINGGAELYYEYGFERVAVQEYIHITQSMVVEIYRMRAPEGAFGIYTINRNDNKPLINIGDGGTLDDYNLSFWQDRYYVNVMAYVADESSQTELQRIASAISSKIENHVSPPGIIELLPKNNLKEQSVCYVMGKLGLNSRYYLSADNVFMVDDNDVRGVWGTFISGDANCMLFVTQYPDAGTATMVRLRLENLLEEKYHRIDRQLQYAIATDEQGRSFLCGSGNNIVALIVKSSNLFFAQQLMEEVINQNPK